MFKIFIQGGISDDIPPQMNILNMVIPILMHLCTCLLFIAKLFVGTLIVALQATCHLTKCDVINDIILSDQMSCYNSMCLRIFSFCSQINSGTHKMLVRIENREDPDQNAFSGSALFV